MSPRSAPPSALWKRSSATTISSSIIFSNNGDALSCPGDVVPAREQHVIASFRSRNGEALKVAEKFQGGGHANACGATLPKSVRTIPDAVAYLRQVLNPKKEAPLNSLENIFDSIDLAQK